MLKIGVKFCGGCRAGYDRAEVEAKIEDRVRRASPARAAFVSARTGETYDTMLVLCGCKSICPRLEQYDFKKVVFVAEADDADYAAEHILSMAKVA